jgi:tetratricopeptide (TPR) repeat protein
LPQDDPKAENARLINLGQAAFAAAEYGRAAERFRRATAAAPQEPFAHFLLAQALFTLGKYQAAVDAVFAGLTLQPDWPAAAFRPIELYGPNVADYAQHLQGLEDTLRRHPDDPDLLFLYAYQLWFDGRRDEARVLFERARRAGADPAAIDRFLRALPPAPVV